MNSSQPTAALHDRVFEFRNPNYKLLLCWAGSACSRTRRSVLCLRFTLVVGTIRLVKSISLAPPATPTSRHVVGKNSNVFLISPTQEKEEAEAEDRRIKGLAAVGHCDACNKPLVAKKAFSRFEFRYCSADCAQVHKRKLAADAAERRFNGGGGQT